MVVFTASKVSVERGAHTNKRGREIKAIMNKISSSAQSQVQSARGLRLQGAHKHPHSKHTSQVDLSLEDSELDPIIAYKLAKAGQLLHNLQNLQEEIEQLRFPFLTPRLSEQARQPYSPLTSRADSRHRPKQANAASFKPHKLKSKDSVNHTHIAAKKVAQTAIRAHQLPRVSAPPLAEYTKQLLLSKMQVHFPDKLTVPLLPNSESKKAILRSFSNEPCSGRPSRRKKTHRKKPQVLALALASPRQLLQHASMLYAPKSQHASRFRSSSRAKAPSALAIRPLRLKAQLGTANKETAALENASLNPSGQITSSPN